MIINTLISDVLSVAEEVEGIDITSSADFIPVIGNYDSVAIVTPSNLKISSTKLTIPNEQIKTRVTLPIEIWVKYVPSKQGESVPLIRGLGEDLIYKLLLHENGTFVLDPELPIVYTIAPNLFEGDHSTAWFVGTVTAEYIYKVSEA